jgi:peptidoglycan/xylan/chitin deacetylase (PgdA/CDA1 family)
MSMPTILMYHAISDDMQPGERAFSTPPTEFSRQMAMMKDLGYRTVTMREVAESWTTGRTLPPQAVVITFDDAYDCVINTALPMMARHGFTATVYAISGFLGKPNSYDAQYGATPRRICSAGQLVELHSCGIEIGSHTVSHRPLPSIAPQEIETEFTDSRKHLEDVLSTPVRSLAYPYGAFTADCVRLAETCGYASAVSTVIGKNGRSANRFALRRATVGAGHDDAYFLRLLKLGGDPYQLAKASIKRAVLTVFPKALATRNGPRNPSTVN